jgi:MSHA biogenesis protein MshN
MSLINQMLQELEQRKAADVPVLAQHMPTVHAVKPPQKLRMLPLLILAAVFVGAYGLSKMQSKLNVGMSATFMLPSSATIINDANAEMEPQVTVRTAPAPLPVASNVPISFEPKLDKHLANLPTIVEAEQSVKVASIDRPVPRLHMARLTPAITKHELPALAYDKAVALALPSPSPAPTATAEEAKIEAQMPLSSQPEGALQAHTAKSASKSAHAKMLVNKRLSPEQQAAHDYQQAIAYLQQGRVAEAQDLLRNVLNVTPNHEDARQTLVGLLVDNQHKAEAMEILQSGLKLSAAQPEFARTLARLQLDVGQTAEALQTLQASLPYAKQHAEYQALMAVVLQRLDRHQEAILHYQQALSLGAEVPAWLIGLAVSLQTEGRAEEAKQTYQQAQRANLTPELAQFVDQRLKQVQ